MKNKELDAVKRECRENEQMLTRRLEQYTSPQQQNYVDVESGNSNNNNTSSVREEEILSLIENLKQSADRMESVGNQLSHGAGAANSASVIAIRAQVSRYRNIAQQHYVEFTKHRDQAKQKRERMLLLQRAENSVKNSGGEGDEMYLLQKERNSIHNSIRHIDENISKAQAIREAIENQTEKLRLSATRVVKMGENIPGINNLIKAASNKKTRDNMIVATFIALCLVFILWWLVRS